METKCKYHNKPLEELWPNEWLCEECLLEWARAQGYETIGELCYE